MQALINVNKKQNNFDNPLIDLVLYIASIYLLVQELLPSNPIGKLYIARIHRHFSTLKTRLLNL